MTYVSHVRRSARSASQERRRVARHTALLDLAVPIRESGCGTAMELLFDPYTRGPPNHEKQRFSPYSHKPSFLLGKASFMMGHVGPPW